MQKSQQKSTKDKSKFKPLFNCSQSNAFGSQEHVDKAARSSVTAEENNKARNASKYSQKGRPVLSSGRGSDLADKGESISARKARQAHGGTGPETAAGERLQTKTHQHDSHRSGQGSNVVFKKKVKRTAPGSTAAKAGDNDPVKLVMKPNRMNFNNKEGDEHAKSAKPNKRHPPNLTAANKDLLSSQASAAPMSPPPRLVQAKESMSQPRRARAPRKLSKDIERESSKQLSLATPTADKHSNNDSVYQTRGKHGDNTPLQEFRHPSQQQNQLKDPRGQANGTRADEQRIMPNVTVSVSQQDKPKQRSKLQVNLQNKDYDFNKIIIQNRGRGPLDLDGRRDIRVLQSLNSPEQRDSEWFSGAMAAKEEAEKSFEGHARGASNDGLKKDSNRPAINIASATSNHLPSQSRHPDYGECEDESNPGAVMSMSWNSNLLSHEGKQLQALRMVSPNALSSQGRNLDELPQLDSRQLSEGEENILATQRYTESSQQDDAEARAFFNQTSDQEVAMGALRCEPQQAAPYSERRSYQPSTNNPSPRPEPSRNSSCQVSESDHQLNSGNEQANLSKIIAGASQSENLTDEAENQEFFNQ